MYTYTVNLVQQTPIIHFQHDQPGATLRATELKPKLDRWISRLYYHLNSGANLFQDKRDWFTGDNKKSSLSYKIRIVSKAPPNKFLFTSMPVNRHDQARIRNAESKDLGKYINQTQYFANNECIRGDDIREGSTPRLGLLSESTIEFHISSFSLSLIQFLKSEPDIINSFFCSTNFGSRQSKGFGVFLPEGFTDEYLLKLCHYQKSVVGIYKKSDKSHWERKIQNTAKEYSELKRGKSYGGYQKSELWEYFCSDNIGWEKRKIKLELRNQNPTLFNQLKYETTTHRLDRCVASEESKEYLYLRALLGLAEQYEFQKQDSFERMKVRIKDNGPVNQRIDRFSSPIRYIITNDAVYLVVTEIPKSFLQYPGGDVRKFEFSINGITPFTLPLPQTFDIAAFMKFYSSKHGYEKLH